MKEWKKLLIVELKDWSRLYTEKTLDELENFLTRATDFIRIDWTIFWKYEFKKAYERNIDWIEWYILDQPKDIQDILRTREKQKKERIGRWFDTIEEINNFLQSKKDNGNTTQ